MSIWTGLQMYGLIAVAMAGTSYLRIYRPAMELLLEILDEEYLEDASLYSGAVGTISWFIISIIATPYILFILLKNDNATTIRHIASHLATRVIEEQE